MRVEYSRLRDFIAGAFRELLCRQEDPNDRRARRVTISQAGRKFITTMMRRRAEAELKLMESLLPEEQRTVIRAMELLAGAARRKAEDDA